MSRNSLITIIASMQFSNALRMRIFPWFFISLGKWPNTTYVEMDLFTPINYFCSFKVPTYCLVAEIIHDSMYNKKKITQNIMQIKYNKDFWWLVHNLQKQFFISKQTTFTKIHLGYSSDLGLSFNLKKYSQLENMKSITPFSLCFI